MSDKKLYLLDGMALVYRGHFALMRNPPMTTQGMNTAAVFTVANLLLSLLDKVKPTHLAVAFDTPEPTHRHKEFTEYKAQRESMPEELSTALPYVFRLFEGFNVPILRLPGWEADDVIGTLAKRAELEGVDTYMVTPDKDYGQLVSDHIFIAKPGGASDQMEILDVDKIKEKWGIDRIEQVVDILGLVGDTSDNVPGVPGIGPKTAQKLIAQFGSVEALLESSHQLKGKQKERIEENREQALMSKRLVTISLDVPVDLEIDDLLVAQPDDEKLKPLFRELEFAVFSKRLWGEDLDAIAVEEGGSLPTRNIENVDHNYEVVADGLGRIAIVAQLQQAKRFCFDLETDGLDPKCCKILGVAIGVEAGGGWYWPVPEQEGGEEEVIKALEPLFTSPDVELVGHNLKFDLSVLRWRGIRVLARLFDTMLAAHLSLPDVRRTMDALAAALLDYAPISIETLIGERGDDQKNLSELPVEVVMEYAVEDADITLQMADKLAAKLDETGQARLFREEECPLIPVLVDMEYEGIRMDVDRLSSLSSYIRGEIDAARGRVFELAGEEFDLDSPRQVGHMLFEKLELDPNARRTAKTGQYQTTEQVLQRLAARHEIVERILHYRTCTKLQSVYLEQLPHARFEQTGRVHTQYEQAVIATGRLQSHNPNLQTIPIRTELGRRIREAFVPRDDNFLILAADYSQIELRIAAELSNDESLLETFQRGEDVHATTAMKVYGVEADGVTDEMRRKAKVVNFGIIYGISAFGLADRLNIPRAEGADLIDGYLNSFPGIRDYMDSTIEFAHKNGFVETMTGRRRYLRNINSANGTTRRSEERNAVNSRIQGSGADLIKLAMIRINHELYETGMETRMLLQVHDELVFDLHRDEVREAPALIEEAMRTALPFRVPIVVETGVGENWLEAH